jgi:hypothetical protein
VTRPQAQKHIEAEIRRVRAMRDQFHTDTPMLDAKLTNLRERLVALHR